MSESDDIGLDLPPYANWKIGRWGEAMGVHEGKVKQLKAGHEEFWKGVLDWPQTQPVNASSAKPTPRIIAPDALTNRHLNMKAAHAREMREQETKDPERNQRQLVAERLKKLLLRHRCDPNKEGWEKLAAILAATAGTSIAECVTPNTWCSFIATRDSRWLDIDGVSRRNTELAQNPDQWGVREWRSLAVHLALGCVPELKVRTIADHTRLGYLPAERETEFLTERDHYTELALQGDPAAELEGMREYAAMDIAARFIDSVNKGGKKRKPLQHETIKKHRRKTKAVRQRLSGADKPSGTITAWQTYHLPEIAEHGVTHLPLSVREARHLVAIHYYMLRCETQTEFEAVELVHWDDQFYFDFEE
jgi:hypothetical protein